MNRFIVGTTLIVLPAITFILLKGFFVSISYLKEGTASCLLLMSFGLYLQMSAILIAKKKAHFHAVVSERAAAMYPSKGAGV